MKKMRKLNIVEWFDNLMKIEHERKRMKKVVELAFKSHGDAKIELELINSQKDKK